MRAKDSARLSAVRLLLAAIKQREVDERIELSDADVVAVIEKMLKQRRDSISQFEAGGRQDLVDQETVRGQGARAPICRRQLTEAEIEQAVTEAIAAAGAKSAQDMGKVMAALEAAAGGARRHGQGVGTGEGQAGRLNGSIARAGNIDRWVAKKVTYNGTVLCSVSHHSQQATSEL